MPLSFVSLCGSGARGVGRRSNLTERVDNVTQTSEDMVDKNYHSIQYVQWLRSHLLHNKIFKMEMLFHKDLLIHNYQRETMAH